MNKVSLEVIQEYFENPQKLLYIINGKTSKFKKNIKKNIGKS